MIFSIALGALFLIEQAIPDVQSPIYFIPGLFLTFFILGFGEEVGWMGYAFDPMQKKSGSIKASIVLGLIWALWHLPFYIFMVDDFSSILFMLICLFGTRIILARTYNNTNQSVFAVICAHSIFNVSISVTPNYQIPSGIILTSVLIMITVVVITISGGMKQKNFSLKPEFGIRTAL